MLLHQWPRARGQRLVISLKIFVKEGLFYGLMRGDGKNFRRVLKSLFGLRGFGGHLTLPRSISQGFKTRGIDFDENKFSKEVKYKTCFVVKDPECLRWAIELKRQGLIEKLIAGPMIVNFPFE